MKSPLSVYQDKIEQHQTALNSLKKKLFASSMLRLTAFLLFAFLIYFYSSITSLVLLFVFLGIASFLYLVSRHTDLQQDKEKLKQLIQLNETEISVLNRNFHHLPNGEEFVDPQHEFSQDIDLFGKRSFFQYLNRTALASGKQKLANLLSGNNIEHIEKKQHSIQELAEKLNFRQEFTAIAKMAKAKIKAPIILQWFKDYKTFVPSVFKWLPKVFSAVSLVLFIALSLDYIPWFYLAGWFIIGWIIISRFAKKVNELSGYVSEIQSTFQQYHLLLGLIENEDFKAELNKNHQKQIEIKAKKASNLVKEFSKIIDGLERKNFMIFGQVISGFMLWDLWKAYELEQWILKYANRTENWFEAIDYFDAYNSLGGFAFNHQSYTYPSIQQNDVILKTTEAVHPLINPKDAVKNDYQIDEQEFFIITGANMAGKSTFLRTVSLQLVMGNIGLPVCAKTCEYSPIKLITSMRTVDSLADEASYFYSELSRLKFIVDEIKSDKYFIILDEILKGTNSTDKAIGSRKFVEKLINSHSTGIIATHDLSLCEVANELPQVKNHYFDAEIINDELHFDYKFKDGICQNMNASFLLRKMNIVDE
ncbi:MutS-related protein [Mesonia aestuariivivens]|uniref:DNA mismatch repair protein MutS n=1 Tax=Mesonia aestuariivivens TaxID=2796128 RepID=A0ABS6W3X4_9FLAO|nr:DNA mismatch repair protein MutS [Mesonia aestuariivivens]MBW2962562.1 DNA mismatch repair protein MutS [Mesonia aestuariivivens]